MTISMKFNNLVHQTEINIPVIKFKKYLLQSYKTG